MTHQIAFLGTGIMGAPMAANLMKVAFAGRRRGARCRWQCD